MTAATTHTKPPSIARRLGASVYEFTLLFGIYFVTGAAIQTLFTFIGQAAPTWLIQLVIFVAFGGYFSYSWQKTGQTLAQKTWHIQILSASGALPNAKQAWLRYVAGYLGVFPALVLALSTLRNHPTNAGLNVENFSGFFVQLLILLVINWLALLGTSLLNPERRAVHELISGTQSVFTKN